MCYGVAKSELLKLHAHTVKPNTQFKNFRRSSECSEPRPMHKKKHVDSCGMVVQTTEI